MTRITDLETLDGFGDGQSIHLTSTLCRRLEECVKTARRAVEDDDLELLVLVLNDISTRSTAPYKSLTLAGALVNRDRKWEWAAELEKRQESYIAMAGELNRMQDELAAEES